MSRYSKALQVLMAQQAPQPVQALTTPVSTGGQPTATPPPASTPAAPLPPPLPGGIDPNSKIGKGLLSTGQYSDPGVYDKSLVDAETKKQQDIYDQFYSDTEGRLSTQQQMLKDLLDKRRETLQTDLTTGQSGEDFRRYYNRLGLLDSGAFNKGLSDSFANLATSEEEALSAQDISNQGILQDIAGQKVGITSDLSLAGLQRQFGLEDIGTTLALQKILLAQRKGQQQQQGLFGLAGAGVGSFWGPGGASAGYNIGSGAGSLFDF